MAVSPKGICTRDHGAQTLTESSGHAALLQTLNSGGKGSPLLGWVPGKSHSQFQRPWHLMGQGHL